MDEYIGKIIILAAIKSYLKSSLEISFVIFNKTILFLPKKFNVLQRRTSLTKIFGKYIILLCVNMYNAILL